MTTRLILISAVLAFAAPLTGMSASAASPQPPNPSDYQGLSYEAFHGLRDAATAYAVKISPVPYGRRPCGAEAHHRRYPRDDSLPFAQRDEETSYDDPDAEVPLDESYAP